MKEQTATPSFGAGRRKPYRRVAAVPEVQSITNAAEAHSQEMHGRMVKYATAMGIRMVCIALVFAFDGWYKLIPVVGAVLLPWVAVVIANGGADIAHQETTELLDAAPPLEIPTAPVSDDDEIVVLQGEIVDDSEADEPDLDASDTDASDTDASDGGAPSGDPTAADIPNDHETDTGHGPV
jgi:Protein of unknown function (DUF3099)